MALIAAPATADEGVRVTIEGGIPAVPTPLTARFDGLQPEPGAYRLTTDSGDAGELVGQVDRVGDETILTVIVDRDSVGDASSRRLEPIEGPEPSDGVRIDPSGGDLTVRLDGEPFAVYRSKSGNKPIVYPIIGPNDAPITRAFPMNDVEGEDRDHPHQRSFWFSHGDVDGVDFWASDPRNGDRPHFGTIEQTALLDVADGPVAGLIRTANDWKGPDGAVLCSDERVWRAYDLDGGPRVIDFDVTITASNGPVTFGDTKEGTFGLRLASSMNVKRRDGGRIVNAEGFSDYDAWGKPSPWVDYSGPVDGAIVGVAILNHPESTRFPTTWHVRDYGLFAANPFGYGDFKVDEPGDLELEDGESIRFRYRVVLHEGDAEEAEIESLFRAYAEPPTLSVSVD